MNVPITITISTINIGIPKMIKVVKVFLNMI